MHDAQSNITTLVNMVFRHVLMIDVVHLQNCPIFPSLTSWTTSFRRFFSLICWISRTRCRQTAAAVTNHRMSQQPEVTWRDANPRRLFLHFRAKKFFLISQFRHCTDTLKNVTTVVFHLRNKKKILQIRQTPFIYNTDVYILCGILWNFMLTT